MSLDDKIDAAVAKLMAGSDPVEVLRGFAEEVGEGQTVERIVEQNTCSDCGEEEVLCFGCKVREVVGDQAAMALPLMLPKLMEMAKATLADVVKERRRKSVAKRRAAAQGKTEWPNDEPGPQRF